MIIRILSREEGAAVVIFAIGENDQYLVILAFLSGKGGDGRLNRFGDGSSALRNDRCIECINILAKRLVVEGEGTLQEGGAGKCNQAEAIIFGEAQQIERGQFCAREAIGGHIGGEHAARSV